MANLSTEEKLLGSLLQGASVGLGSYGRGLAARDESRAKTAEEKAKERDQMQKEIQKREQEYQTSISELQFRAEKGDPEAQALLEETQKYNEGRQVGDRRVFSKDTAKRLWEMRQGEEDENVQFYQELLKQSGYGANEPGTELFPQYARESGINPANLDTQASGDKLAALTNALTQYYQPGVQGPAYPTDMFARANKIMDETAYQKAYKKADIDKRIEAEFGKPPEPKPTNAQRGQDAAEYEIAKQDALAAAGRGEKPKKETWTSIEKRLRKDAVVKANDIWSQVPEDKRNKAGVMVISTEEDMEQISKKLRTKTGLDKIREMFGRDNNAEIDTILAELKEIALDYASIGSTEWRDRYLRWIESKQENGVATGQE